MVLARYNYQQKNSWQIIFIDNNGFRLAKFRGIVKITRTIHCSLKMWWLQSTLTKFFQTILKILQNKFSLVVTRLKVNSVLDREPMFSISNHISIFKIFPNLSKSFKIYSNLFKFIKLSKPLKFCNFFTCPVFYVFVNVIELKNTIFAKSIYL